MLITRFDPFKQFFPMPYVDSKYRDTDKYETVMAFNPISNTRESENAYHVEIDLPGLSKEDIKIDLNDKTLTIYGERNIKNEIKEEDYYKVESSFGKFQRQFTLPENVDLENISANSKDGVLEIVLPKTQESVKKKSIEIK